MNKMEKMENQADWVIIARKTTSDLIDQLILASEIKTRCEVALEAIGHDMFLPDKIILFDKIDEKNKIIQDIKLELLAKRGEK